ncbi:MAG: hypothetical protein ACI4GY_01835 [Acutalibacteraceae bacterium]
MKKSISLFLTVVLLLSIGSVICFGEDYEIEFFPDDYDTDLGEYYTDSHGNMIPIGNGTSLFSLGENKDGELYDVTYLDLECAQPQVKKEIRATKAYTVTGLPLKNNMQKCYVATTYIYVCQVTGTNVYLSRCRINGNTATYQDKMILRNFGHNQTLELYEHNGKVYMWVGCRPNKFNYKNGTEPCNFTTALGRIEYKANETISDYSDICRFVSPHFANTTGESFDHRTSDEGTKIEITQRIDAALSSDKQTVVLATRSLHNKIQYSEYDNETLNNILDEKENDTKKHVSFYQNEELKNACLFSCVQDDDERILPNRSCQGIDATSVYCSIYISGGTGVNLVDDENLAYTPKIGKMVKNSSGGYTYKTCVKLKNTHSDYTSISKYANLPLEIEGVQIKGDLLYFALLPTADSIKSGTQYIYSIDKTIL